MRGTHHIGIAVVTLALAAGAGISRAGVPPKRSADGPVDEKLLEFLGSVDPPADSSRPDDGGWLEYLSQVDIGKLGKAPRTSQAPATPKPAGPAVAAGKPGG